MLCLIAVLSLIFIVLLRVNNYLARKLANKEMMFYFLYLILHIGVHTIWKDEKIEDFFKEMTKWNRFKFIMTVIGYGVKLLLYKILEFVTNLSLLLANAMLWFMIAQPLVGWFTGNEQIITYIALTLTLLMLLIGRRVYEFWYKIFGVTHNSILSNKDHDEQKIGAGDELRAAFEELVKDIEDRYDYRKSIQSLSYANLKAPTFFIAAILVVITNIQSVGGVVIFRFDWWNELISVANYSVLTFIAIDRF